MLFYITLCLAASLAAGLKDDTPPVWSPTFTLRMEVFDESGIYEHSRVWVDNNVNCTRKDYLDGHLYKEVYKFDENTMDGPLVYLTFPVTTEEHLNVQECFIVTSWLCLLYEGVFYTLPSMKGANFVGHERMHDEDTSKWKLVSRWTSGIFNATIEIMVWVADRDGFSAPVRMHVTIKDANMQSRHESQVNFYDYDPSEIDPEVWNTFKGMDCNIAAESDVKGLFTSEEIAYLNDVSRDLNSPHHSHDYLKYFNNYNTKRQMYRHKLSQLTERRKNMGNAPVHTTDSLSSKALPFPYTAEEIKRLSQKLPKDFDWRMYGAVTSNPRSNIMVVDYATTAVQAVEGALFLHNGRKRLVELSAQAIVDCSWGFGNGGMGAGSIGASLEWMIKHGVPLAIDYPYVGLNGNCYIDSVDIETKVKAFYKVPSNDPDALKVALVNHGPIPLIFDGWNVIYEHGFFNDTEKCFSDPGSGNFNGLLVGYGHLDGEEFWTIRASYSGYLRVTTRNNTCGILNSPVYVTVE